MGLNSAQHTLDVIKTGTQLRFLMMTTYYPPYNFGGDGIYIYRLTNELARRGHKVDVVHCADAYYAFEKSGPKGDYPNHPNVTVTVLKSRLGILSPLITQQTMIPFRKVAKIKELVARNKYDVIHYHNMSLIGLQALAIGDAIKLYTMHEHWLVCPMHVLWKFNKEVCRKRSCIRCQIHGKRPVQLWRYSSLMDDYLQQVDAFISPSVFTKNKHHELGFDKPIEHIPYFLPEHEKNGSESVPAAYENDRPYFLFVGRLRKIKGLQNLIPVFQKYKHCDLLIAGDGEYEGQLRKLARGIDNIKFLGRLPYQKLQGFYQNTLAVLVPSICCEVFGIIILESFTKKTPVIVNNLGALPEVVAVSGGGFVYDSEEELIAHMEKFRLNPGLRTELGKKGYHAYKKFWSEEPHLKDYLGLIKSIARRKQSKKQTNKRLVVERETNPC